MKGRGSDSDPAATDVYRLNAKQNYEENVKDEQACQTVCESQSPCSIAAPEDYCCKGYHYDEPNNGGCYTMPMDYAYATLTDRGYKTTTGVTMMKISPSNPLRGSTVQEIHMIDVNEAPRLEGYIANIFENSIPGTNIGLPVPAPDDDGDLVHFSIAGWYEGPRNWGAQERGLEYSGKRTTM